MKRLAIALVLVLGAAFLFSEKLSGNRESELEANIAREIELRKIEDYGADDRFSPSQMIANPPVPIGDVVVPQQLRAPPVDPNPISDRIERDQIRRDIESLKRQAELERMDRQIQQREDERRAARKDREHFLGLDHPQ